MHFCGHVHIGYTENFGIKGLRQGFHCLRRVLLNRRLKRRFIFQRLHCEPSVGDRRDSKAGAATAPSKRASGQQDIRTHPSTATHRTGTGGGEGGYQIQFPLYRLPLDPVHNIRVQEGLGLGHGADQHPSPQLE